MLNDRLQEKLLLKPQNAIFLMLFFWIDKLSHEKIKYWKFSNPFPSVDSRLKVSVCKMAN